MFYLICSIKFACRSALRRGLEQQTMASVKRYQTWLWKHPPGVGKLLPVWNRRTRWLKPLSKLCVSSTSVSESNETQLQTETNHCKLFTNFGWYWCLLTDTVTSLHRSEYKPFLVLKLNKMLRIFLAIKYYNNNYC